jgi:16S rRNA (adenine1518-N6/adenine1519-N6)-dimethyltransferase
MIETYKRSELAKLCQEHEFRFSKALGQNFLADRNIIEKILDASGAEPDDDVFEIGAGAGALTVPLAKRARRVFAVEIDHRLIPILKRVTEGIGNIEILHDDYLRIDPGGFSERHTLIGNLPYSLTSPILAKAIEERPQRMVFMVQKEVAERLLAQPGGRDYGAISVLAQYHTEAKRVCDVSREVFMPRPNVDSMVLRFDPRDNARDDTETVRLMFRLVKAGFSMRRKTLRNSLGKLGVPEETLLSALEAVGVDPGLRAETLAPRRYYAIAEALRRAGAAERAQ